MTISHKLKMDRLDFLAMVWVCFWSTRVLFSWRNAFHQWTLLRGNLSGCAHLLLELAHISKLVLQVHWAGIYVPGHMEVWRGPDIVRKVFDPCQNDTLGDICKSYFSENFPEPITSLNSSALDSLGNAILPFLFLIYALFMMCSTTTRKEYKSPLSIIALRPFLWKCGYSSLSAS